MSKYEEDRRFLQDYQNFLLSRGYAESTANVYALRLENFLNSNFSVRDLIGAVDMLIVQYSKGGSAYQPSDRGCTLNALNRLNDYILAPYLDTFCLEFRDQTVAWTVKTEAMIGYTIYGNRNVTVLYNTGKKVTKTANYRDFCRLLKLLLNNHMYLCTGMFGGMTTPSMFDAPSYAYDLRLGDIFMVRCARIFQDTAPVRLRNTFRDLIESICK